MWLKPLLWSIFFTTLFVSCMGNPQVDEENPYTVRIASYRASDDADSSMDRLNELEFPAYVLPRSNKRGDVWHDLMVGAFPEKKEALALQKELRKEGLKNAKVLHYDQLKKGNDQYHELGFLERMETTAPYAGEPEVPEAVLENMKSFPVDQNFRVVNLAIANSIELQKHKNWMKFYIPSSYRPRGTTTRSLIRGTKAVSHAVYQDKLFKKMAGVTILTPDEDGTDALIKTIKKRAGSVVEKDLSYNTHKGTVKGDLYKRSRSHYTFIGQIDNQWKHHIVMVSKTMKLEDFKKLAMADNDGSGLLQFPEIENNLAIFPRNTSSDSYQFGNLVIRQVGWKYARERSNAWWARMVVGNWRATAGFYNNDKPVSVSFFNMVREATAKKVHGNFMQEKRKVNRNTTAALRKMMGITVSTPAKVNGVDGWYISFRTGSNEVSFIQKNLVIAVNSYYPRLKKEGLETTGENLPVW